MEPPKATKKNQKKKEELEELAGRAEQSSDRLQTGEENTREQGRLREEDELEERAKGRRRTAALDPARDDDRTRPMEEEIEERVVPEVKESTMNTQKDTLIRRKRNQPQMQRPRRK